MQSNMARGGAERFSRRLIGLKEAGSTLLVVGRDPGARAAVSSRLLGHAEQHRVPLFVLLGRGRSVIDERLQGERPVRDSQVIEYGFTRSAASSSATAGDLDAERLDSLGYLLDDVAAAVNTIDDRPGEALVPGDLRVCLDSMTAVVDGFERESVEAFLHDLGTVVEEHAGMGHALLPLQAVPDRYDWLEAAFDVVIETRDNGGVVQERWRLAYDDLATGWFCVDGGASE